jgi:hypothetical protein
MWACVRVASRLLAWCVRARARNFCAGSAETRFVEHAASLGLREAVAATVGDGGWDERRWPAFGLLWRFPILVGRLLVQQWPSRRDLGMGHAHKTRRARTASATPRGPRGRRARETRGVRSISSDGEVTHAAARERRARGARAPRLEESFLSHGLVLVRNARAGRRPPTGTTVRCGRGRRVGERLSISSY